jgi:prevent-host-death family protein
VKQVSIQKLKAKLSALVSEAAAGTPILITRHKRAVAQLVPVDPHVHTGTRFGDAKLKPLLKRATRGRYLEVLADDRRGGVDER